MQVARWSSEKPTALWVNMTGVHVPGHYPAADGHWDVVFDRCQLPLAWYSIERSLPIELGRAAISSLSRYDWVPAFL